MIFFSLGYFIKQRKLNVTWLIVGMVVYALIWGLIPSNVDMRTGATTEGLNIVWIVNSFIGIMVFDGVFRIILNNINILSKIGQKTMPYYCMHWIIITAVSIFFAEPTKGVPDYPFLWALLAANLIFLPLFTYLIEKSRFRYIIA